MASNVIPQYPMQVRDPRTGTVFDLVHEECSGYQGRDWYIVRTSTHEFGPNTTIRVPREDFCLEIKNDGK